jgi:3',5'-cyclic AMP phosphodiesterase CpdA
MLRIAHLSDPHLSLRPGLNQLGLKRLLGRLNWLLQRRFFHREARLATAIQSLLSDPPAVVLATGDLGQLGLPQEIERAGTALQPLAARGIPVLVTNGNHDQYGQDAAAAAAWAAAQQTLAAGIDIDNAGVATVNGAEIVLIQQGRPTPAFRSWGSVGADALARLRDRLSAPPPPAGRLAAGHYPLLTARGFRLPRGYRVREDQELQELFVRSSVSAYFCGHIHRPFSIALSDDCAQHCAGSITGAGRVRRFVCEGGEVAEEG